MTNKKMNQWKTLSFYSKVLAVNTKTMVTMEQNTMTVIMMKMTNLFSGTDEKNELI